MKIIIILFIALLSLTFVSCTPDEEPIDWEEKYLNLDISYGVMILENKRLEDENNSLLKELNEVNIQLVSSVLYIAELESRYVSAYSFGKYAEQILKANGINFSMMVEELED